MTEVEWLASDDLGPMLNFVRGKTSDRKVRLFAVACCRCVWWPYLDDERSKQAVEVAERFADASATPAERTRAERIAKLATKGKPGGQRYWAAVAAQMTAAKPLPVEPFISVLGVFRGTDEERRQQRRLAGDIFRNSFRSAVLQPAWLTSTVTSLAEGAYMQGAFDRLPILADALEDAGCTDAAILEHCRGPGPHVRGCWVVDQILAKE
jgi:hypothetical protein